MREKIPIKHKPNCKCYLCKSELYINLNAPDKEPEVMSKSVIRREAIQKPVQSVCPCCGQFKSEPGKELCVKCADPEPEVVTFLSHKESNDLLVKENQDLKRKIEIMACCANCVHLECPHRDIFSLRPCFEEETDNWAWEGESLD